MASILGFAKTIHLFVKTDYKTVMLPVTALSYFAAPHTSPTYFARGISWTFLNLLFFCISNQVFDPEEDALNKPWRPIPAGRISVRGANFLRAMILPICLWLAYTWGVMPQTLLFILLGSFYNDFNIGAHWAPRQASVAVMYGALNSAAARAACDRCTGDSDPIDMLRHIMNSLIILTTIQAADFRDADGDGARGRSTIPLRWPCVLSHAHMLIKAIFVLAGLATGLRFQLLKNPKSDRHSYLYYDIWLGTAQVLLFV